MLPFLPRPSPAKIFHLAVQAFCYCLALAFFPFVSEGVEARPFFAETYFGCIGLSAALGLLALLLKPGMALYVLLSLRCYVLAILGYGIGGFLSVKLVLGVGLMVELGILADLPYNLVFAALFIAFYAIAWTCPLVFGSNSLVGSPVLPGSEELLALCFVLAFAAAVAAWIGRATAARRAQEELLRIQEANLDTLAELNLNLQGYARTVDEASTERERNRISREIHDISGYIFTNLIALMDAAGSMRRDDQAGLSDILVTARAQAQEGLRETRAALRKLRKERPDMADSTRAIYKIVSIFRKIAGIEVELSMGNLPHFLSQELNLALYRTVQEALTNAVRHGKATRVRVLFWVESGDILLTIADDGKGAFEVVKGIGLTGMEERIGALGGTIGIGQAAEGGFSLSVRVPLKLAPAGGE
jgi:signal transduction histidine kinase